MKTAELRRRIREFPLDFVLWLFRPPGLFFSLWHCCFYKEWPDDG